MTVADLILLLQQMPQDVEVIRGDSEYESDPITRVTWASEEEKRESDLSINQVAVVVD